MRLGTLQARGAGLLATLFVACAAAPIDAVPVDAVPVEVEAEPDETRAETASDASALERVVVVGASASAGALLAVELSTVLGAMLDFEHDPRSNEPSARAPRARTDALFFLHPVTSGREQIDFAREAQPTLLVALDFLFWFSYGANGPDGRRLGSEEGRLELLEHGLGLLEEFSCPLLVSDLPDMSDAIGKMLMASQVPSPAMRARLNARILAWADGRPNVRVLPLARVHETMRSGLAFDLGRYRWPAGSGADLLQWDQLHPTLEGLLGLVHLIGTELVAAGWVPEGELQLELPRLMDRFGVKSRVVARAAAEATK